MQKTVGFTLFAFFLFLSTEILAGRKVTIPIDKELKLSNSSAVNVTYNLSCKDKDGVTVSDYVLTGQSIPAGQTRSVILSDSSVTTGCGAGWTATPLTGALPTLKSCNSGGGVPFSSINSACSSNAHVCSLTELAAKKGTLASGDGAFVSSGVWSYYNNTNATWTDYTGNSTNYGNAKFYSGAYDKYNNGSMGTGAVTFSHGGWVTLITNNAYSVFCCLTYSDISQCEIEITNDGHLSSPQFLGGKAF